MAAAARKKSLHGPGPLNLGDNNNSTNTFSLGNSNNNASSSSTPSLPLSTPIVQNTLLNKGASSSSSLYQQCSLLRTRLTRVQGFSVFFPLAASSSLTSQATRTSTIDGSGFPFQSQQPKRDSSNPVNQLWDLFRLGVPMCYIWNLHPPYDSEPISAVDSRPEVLDPSTGAGFGINDAKKGIIFFSMAITKLKNTGQWKGPPSFTVGELQGDDTNGFVKVVHAVSHLLDLLPAEFLPSPDQPGASDALRAALPPSGTDEHERARKFVVNELLSTERKYVQDLENLHAYTMALVQEKIVTQDTVHEIFSNLRHILDHQRRFLIEVEKTAELPDAEQDWGSVFTNADGLFETYGPYCANFSRGSDLVQEEMDRLVQLPNARIDAKSELLAFLIKPVQRICRYPLLLKDLLKATPASDPRHQSVAEGLEAALAYADNVNESQRRYENHLTTQGLKRRVEDWKGHHLGNFGDLVLDEIFMVTKGDQDREYHVFLFEKIILCCKEQPAPPSSSSGDGRKKSNILAGKNNSLLRKGAGTPGPPPPPPPKNARTTPLSLKGRIYLSNITSAKSEPSQPGASYGYSTAYPLVITWTDINTQEFLVLRCRTEEQLRQWETAIGKLIAIQRDRQHQVRSRAASVSTMHAAHERGFSVGAESRPSIGMPNGNGNGIGLPNQNGTQNQPPYGHPYMHQHQQLPRGARAPFPPGSSSQAQAPSSEYSYSDERDNQPRRRDHAASASVPRGQEPPVLVPPRARTEGTDGPTNSAWRGQYGHTAPPPMPRMMSNMSAQSAQSMQSEASFGGPAPISPLSGQPPLASKFAVGTSMGMGSRQSSQSRMRTVQNWASSSTPDVPTAAATALASAQPRKASATATGARSDSESTSTGSRSRSVSSPAPYVPGGPIRELPPVPVPPMSLAINTHKDSKGPGPKRESGSSQSTAEGETDDSDSPTFPYQSPDTPFGSNDSSLLATAQAHPPVPLPSLQYVRPQPPIPTQQGAQIVPAAVAPAGSNAPLLRTARSQVFSSRSNSPVPTANLPPMPAGPDVPTIHKPIMVKVAFRSDLFAITIPRNIGHQELMMKLRRKIELCGGQFSGPLRIKYMDEEGDLVSLGGPDDLAMAMEVATVSHQIKLFVQP